MNWLRCCISGLSSTDWGAVWLSAFSGRGVQDDQFPAVSKVVVGSRECRWFEIGSAFATDRVEKSGRVARVWWTVVDGGLLCRRRTEKGREAVVGSGLGCVIVGPAVVRCFWWRVRGMPAQGAGQVRSC